MKTVHSLPLGSDMQVGDGYICLGHTAGGPETGWNFRENSTDDKS